MHDHTTKRHSCVVSTEPQHPDLHARRRRLPIQHLPSHERASPTTSRSLAGPRSNSSTAAQGAAPPEAMQISSSSLTTQIVTGEPTDIDGIGWAMRRWLERFAEEEPWCACGDRHGWSTCTRGGKAPIADVDAGVPTRRSSVGRGTPSRCGRTGSTEGCLDRVDDHDV